MFFNRHKAEAPQDGRGGSGDRPAVGEPRRVEEETAFLIPQSDWKQLAVRLDGLEALEARVRKLEADAVAERAALRSQTRSEMGEWAERVERRMRGFDTRLRDTLAGFGPLSDRLTELTIRHEEVDERALALESTVADSRRLLDELGEVLDLVRVAQVEERTDLTREDFLVHYELAGRLKALYTQRMPDLIQPRLAAERPRDVVRRQAELIRRLCLALFGPEEHDGVGDPDLDELTRITTDNGRVGLDHQHQRLLERVGAEAANLSRAMNESGYASRFDFTVEPGAVADPREHALWLSCEAGRPVAFVVCPGYRAADRRLLEPFVFTESGGEG
ncbi:hypothetical protein [Streptomyces sp. NPDC002769]|uniref:hypothetical protein n=1 Tax=Streptomyces sp. NPDC002769 TaxID=3154542 RepID=UPI0033319A72